MEKNSLIPTQRWSGICRGVAAMVVASSLTNQLSPCYHFPLPACGSFAVVVSSSRLPSAVFLLCSQYIQQRFLFCLGQKNCRSLYACLLLILNHCSSWFWMLPRVRRAEQDTAGINTHATIGSSNCRSGGCWGETRLHYGTDQCEEQLPSMHHLDLSTKSSCIWLPTVSARIQAITGNYWATHIRTTSYSWALAAPWSSGIPEQAPM